jgi:hypothetical protein
MSKPIASLRMPLQEHVNTVGRFKQNLVFNKCYGRAGMLGFRHKQMGRDASAWARKSFTVHFTRTAPLVSESEVGAPQFDLVQTTDLLHVPEWLLSSGGTPSPEVLTIEGSPLRLSGCFEVFFRLLRRNQ